MRNDGGYHQETGCVPPDPNARARWARAGHDWLRQWRIVPARADLGEQTCVKVQEVVWNEALGASKREPGEYTIALATLREMLAEAERVERQISAPERG